MIVGNSPASLTKIKQMIKSKPNQINFYNLTPGHLLVRVFQALLHGFSVLYAPLPSLLTASLSSPAKPKQSAHIKNKTPSFLFANYRLK